MNGKVILLTGVPATGKTTLASLLKDTIHPLHVVSFGRLILEVARQNNPDVTYEEIRRNPTQKAKTDLIGEAVRLLLQDIKKQRESTNIIIDSHAVAIDSYGFRITPDSYSFLEQVKYDAVIVLHAPHSEITKRIAAKPDGRRSINYDDIALLESLQDSVAIAYGVASNCPVFILNAPKTNRELIKGALDIFTSINMGFASTKEE